MRHDDPQKKRYYRSSERVFRMNEVWFFATREGDQGPYVSQNEAEREVSRYILEKTELESFQNQRTAAVHRLELEPKDHMLDVDFDLMPRQAVR